MAKDICAEETFETVFRSHAEHLRNFLYYKSGDLELSEDLVQDAFGKLWENCAKVTLEKAKSYLFTIGQNLFLNKMERRKVRFRFQKQNRGPEQV
nr:RNA polymerase subunit sigma-70 [Saprospiraceae bacterium]